MTNDFKKRLKEIHNELQELLSKMEEFADDHQNWMDDHEDDDWDSTPAGEKAADEQYYFEDWRDTISSMADDIEEYI